MATKIRHVKAIIQLRRGTEEEWERKDPVLHLGEPALSTDVYSLKIGDGIHKWSELDYLGISEIEIQRILEDYATKEYVEEYSGKIDSISVGGTAMEIDENKNVDIDNLIFDCGTSTTNI